ncbi:MAG: anthranilate synthase component I [Alphaproteobacteria bacterium]|nr:anthranilate synthase component I [Alphaproteobacteria bacterium]
MTPDYSAFLRRWTQGENQTLSASVVSDLDTPVSAMLKLGQGKPFSFLLESIEGGAVRGRYSIIGREPDVVWCCSRGGKVEVNRDAQNNPQKFDISQRPPLEDLRALLDECRIDDPDQPQPMAAGLFGYLGYDMARYTERLPDDKPQGVDAPEAIMIRPTLLAIFDQIENKFTLVTPVWYDKNAAPDVVYKAAAARLQRALADLNLPLPLREGVGGGGMPQEQTSETTNTAPSHSPPSPTPPLRREGSLFAAPISISNMTEADYVSMVERSKEYIRAGDIFQVVLAQRFALPFTLPPFALYRAIRRLDPSPFLYFFDFGAFSVVGSSPEILVRVRDGKVTIRPIAGTRPRNAGNKTDQELEAELLADPKELAEHLMLLDLGRNDVGRVAKMGTVKVTARNTIEYYKHVMHIVSNVEGELDPKYSALDALMAGFPAGTVSGAPKVRAMEIIAEQEPDRRGIYAGSVGYFGANGSMDTCIAIRTAVIKDGQMYVQAGAGIVYDSDPQAEYRESVAKARGMMRAAEEAVAFAKGD